MKDELNGLRIVEFVGLKSKMYPLVSSDNKEINKAKGVNKKLRIRHKLKRIQSKLHEIGTYDLNKISLTCFDGKKYVLSNGINTLAYFHKDIDHFP